MHERRFSPSQAHRLDATERKLWLPIEPILASLALQPGWTIADIGAGTGYFALPIANLLGPAGKVFAVDVEPEMLVRIQIKLSESNIQNVICALGEASATNLAPVSCNLVFMANVWHEFDDHASVLSEVKRILKPEGKIAILDWNPAAEPPPGPPAAHRIPSEIVLVSLAAAGFEHISNTSAGDFTYLIQATSSS